MTDISNSNIVELLKNKMNKLKESSDENALKYEEAAQRLIMAEKEVGKAELRAESAEHMVKVLQDNTLKYEEAARKLVMAESEIEKIEQRAETAEREVKVLIDKLSTSTTTLRTFENDKEKASLREDSYEKSISGFTARLKDAEYRANEADKTVYKLQKEVDRLEDELVDERKQYNLLQSELVNSKFAF